jgi:uncharacterized protein (TIGR03437 family)
VKLIPRFLIISLALCLAQLLTPAQTPTPTPADEVAIIQSSNLLNAAVGIVRGVSDDGRRIVLESTEDLTAVRDLVGNVVTAGKNADRNREIFVYDTVARAFIQITDTRNVPNDPSDATKGIKINVSNNAPVISGDGTRLAFSSNSGTLADVNDDGNQEIFIATLPSGSTTPTFQRVTRTTGTPAGVREFFDNYTPTINSDGSVIAFVTTRNGDNGLTGITNPDNNSQIVIYNLSTNSLTQVTDKRESEALVNFTPRGFNGNPFLSGDGKVLAFLSAFNYAAAGAAVNNSDFNGEVFIYRVGEAKNQVTQVTNTKDEDIAFPTGSPVNVLSTGTRHLNNAGTLLVFESSADLGGLNADKTREVFLYRVGGTGNQFTRITNQTLPANPTASDYAKIDFNFSPGITADGTQIFFATVQNLTPVSSGSTPLTDNADGSRDVFRFGPIGANGAPAAGARFRQITFTGLSNLVLDQREAIVLVNTNADGTRVALSSNSNIIGTNPDTSQELFQAVVRAVTETRTTEAVLTNAASFAAASGTSAVQVGRGSIVTAFGSQLANSTVITQRPDFDFQLGGVSVTVSNAAAELIYVSPGQINFVLPQGAQTGDTVEFSINNNGVVTKGKAKVADAGPGIFTVNGNGAGGAAATCQSVTTATPPVATFSLPPCAVSNAENRRFINLYGTGVRNAAAGTLTFVYKVGTEDRTLTPQYAGAQSLVQNTFPGLDQINIELPAEFPKGTTKVRLRFTVGTTTVDSNEVEIMTQ